MIERITNKQREALMVYKRTLMSMASKTMTPEGLREGLDDLIESLQRFRDKL